MKCSAVCWSRQCSQAVKQQIWWPKIFDQWPRLCTWLQHIWAPGWSDHHHMCQGARKGKLNNKGWYTLTFGIALDVSNIAYIKYYHTYYSSSYIHDMILPSRLFLNNAHQKVCRALTFSYRLQLTFIPGEIEFGSPVIGKEGSQVSPAHLINHHKQRITRSPSQSNLWPLVLPMGVRKPHEIQNCIYKESLLTVTVVSVSNLLWQTL